MINSEAIISSRHNAVVKHARFVRDGRERELVFIEGVRLCEEAARVESLILRAGFYTNLFLRDERGQKLLSLINEKILLREVSADVFAFISDTKTPQGIALIAERPKANRESFAAQVKTEKPLIVLLNRLNNPANAGSILRTAEAAGASGIIAAEDTVDLFNSKALRGAMGATFRVPLWTGANLSDAAAWARSRNLRVVMLDASAKTAYTAVDWRGGSLIVAGAEAKGFKRDELAMADKLISIPMCAPVESLNVAVATGVILYEAQRQRGAA